MTIIIYIANIVKVTILIHLNTVESLRQPDCSEEEDNKPLITLNRFDTKKILSKIMLKRILSNYFRDIEHSTIQADLLAIYRTRHTSSMTIERAYHTS